MSDEPDLVALLYRADWTRLSLSADVTADVPAAGETGEPPEPGGRETGRSTLLIAPGGLFVETGEHKARGFDGEHYWHLFEPDEKNEKQEKREDRSLRMFGGPEPPCREMLCPAWLLADFTLESRSAVTALGRDALDVVATPRPGVRSRRHDGSDRIEAVVDAELGILLRLERIRDGRTTRVSEITALTLDPPTDPAQFAPLPGSTVSEDWREAFGGPGWQAAKTVAGVAATGLGAAIRHSPHREAPDDPEGAMPRDDDPPADGEVGTELLHLLDQSGAADFTATLHEWLDVAALVQSGADSSGIGGLGTLANAIGQRAPTLHMTANVRFAGPGRYRIEYTTRAHGPSRPKIIASDGQQRWRVYEDWVAVGPAAGTKDQTLVPVTSLADASWLLGCRLSGGTAITVGDRRAFLLRAKREYVSSPEMIFSPADAVVDAELGVLLRLTSYAGETPVSRYELRDISPGQGEFRTDIPDDLRVVEETGKPFDDIPMPDPVRFAVKTASGAARRANEGITAARGFLDSLRGKPR